MKREFCIPENITNYNNYMMDFHKLSSFTSNHKEFDQLSNRIFNAGWIEFERYKKNLQINIVNEVFIINSTNFNNNLIVKFEKTKENYLDLLRILREEKQKSEFSFVGIIYLFFFFCFAYLIDNSIKHKKFVYEN
eukprot:GHVL01018212.1.p1 GENE.GHVL01018212.1~~GHVL01018212.1.p1  ORF type:complete len:135 (-),score=21.94 GHVL01018212.1:211-615(-)